jgi:putative Ca2+/H+ antiporter (TMEM165/GDT1 family)
VSGFLFALLASFVASCGARDQTILAQLSAAQGPRALVLAAALVATAATAALAAWFGAGLAVGMTPETRTMFAALALLLSGAEMLVLRTPRAPTEPTRSVFAAFIVIVAQQITDATRFLILALAVGTVSPVPAAMGGAVGAGAALGLGWGAPQLARDPRVRLGRRLAGGLLVLIGGVLGARIMIG